MRWANILIKWVPVQNMSGFQNKPNTYVPGPKPEWVPGHPLIRL